MGVERGLGHGEHQFYGLILRTLHETDSCLLGEGRKCVNVVIGDLLFVNFL